MAAGRGALFSSADRLCGTVDFGPKHDLFLLTFRMFRSDALPLAIARVERCEAKPPQSKEALTTFLAKSLIFRWVVSRWLEDHFLERLSMRRVPLSAAHRQNLLVEPNHPLLLKRCFLESCSPSLFVAIFGSVLTRSSRTEGFQNAIFLMVPKRILTRSSRTKGFFEF